MRRLLPLLIIILCFFLCFFIYRVVSVFLLGYQASIGTLPTQNKYIDLYVEKASLINHEIRVMAKLAPDNPVAIPITLHLFSSPKSAYSCLISKHEQISFGKDFYGIELASESDCFQIIKDAAGSKITLGSVNYYTLEPSDKTQVSLCDNDQTCIDKTLNGTKYYPGFFRLVNSAYKPGAIQVVDFIKGIDFPGLLIYENL